MEGLDPFACVESEQPLRGGWKPGSNGEFLEITLPAYERLRDERQRIGMG
jgi:hypothetical protein